MIELLLLLLVLIAGVGLVFRFPILTLILAFLVWAAVSGGAS